jgi:predicted porin
LVWRSEQKVGEAYCSEINLWSKKTKWRWTMIGALKQTTSRFAIAAAAGLFTGGIALTPVQAASLGGDCCADLEERVAELEATTVRKGNRKVSVKLSGQVNRGILFWDDGNNSDVYYVDVENSNTRFRITGSASISPGRTAGFRIEADWFIHNNSSQVSNCVGGFNNDPTCQPQANVLGNGSNTGSGGSSLTGLTDMRWQEIWFKDERLGKLSVGKGDMASNGTSEVDLSGTSVAQYAGATDVGGNFWFTNSTTGVVTTSRLGSRYSDFDGASRQNRVRYDTPSFAGFTFSTSVAADDKWDGAIRFKKEWNSVRCAAAIAAYHNTDGDDDEFWQYNGSGSCIHTPSGLNLTLGYATRDLERVRGVSVDLTDPNWFFIKGGISRRWNSHGKTNISIQYATVDDLGFRSAELDMWGVAFVQKIDSAALELYMAYSHYELDDNTLISYDDLDFFLMGARMKF